MTMHFWATLRDHLQSGAPAFVGLVAANSAHSPGTRGARIFVRPDGSTEGTIGGGVMEGDIIQTALTAIKEDAEAGAKGAFWAKYQTLFHRKKGPGTKSGLACAGEQTNLYFVCRPERDLPAFEEVARRIEADEPGCLQVDPSGIRLGAELEIGREYPPVSIAIDGESWHYQEQLLNWKRAAIFGGGHCGLALSRVLSQLGYIVTLFDTRESVFTFVENDYARHKIVVEDFKDGGAKVRYPELTHAIVMTREQPADVQALIGLIERPFPYIGVMGSPAKLAQIRKDLIRAGLDKALFEQVRAPIGLKITSNTPEEIAISIAAELLQERKTLFPHAP